MKKTVFFIELMLLGAAGIFAQAETIKINSFNIQTFGEKKMNNPEVTSILVDIISKADITAIQEVRSAEIAPLLNFMGKLPPKYTYVLGPREGRSPSKEQYWIIYDSTKLQAIADTTWSDPDDIFERNPLGVYFQTAGSFDFILIDNHIQPTKAVREIDAMPEVVRYFQDIWSERDVILVGDFNADGTYYDEGLLTSVFPDNEYKIIITNDFDTSVAIKDNTYDRIIITSSAIEDYASVCGVIRFDEIYDFPELMIRPKNVSDHYPVWAEFFLDADTD
ncbi:deoxyribonuclease [Spirochaetia bacterium]|nr:deoxyribonuclease [Spirochaetia bacterium]